MKALQIKQIVMRVLIKIYKMQNYEWHKNDIETNSFHFFCDFKEASWWAGDQFFQVTTRVMQTNIMDVYVHQRILQYMGT